MEEVAGKVTIQVPKGSVVIIPDNSITGSAALFLVASPWFQYDDAGYFIIPADETNPAELMTALAVAMRGEVE